MNPCSWDASSIAIAVMFTVMAFMTTCMLVKAVWLMASGEDDD